MFRSITLTDFQSHQSTHIPLAPFTVIVGSSSSGKSAIVRAIRVVAENARGTSFVRQGAKSARVALELADPDADASTVVTIERGKAVSTYALRVAGAHGEPVIFTKCSTTVPEAVATAMSLGDSKLWIAGQFDRPYLLDETGSEVARVLGKLTNVTMIFAAVREANRRAAEARRLHSAKAGELESVREQVKAYLTLPARLQALGRAEEALGRADSLSRQKVRLEDYTGDLRAAQQRAVAARSVVRAVPSIDRLVVLSTDRASLATRLGELRAARGRRISTRAGIVHVPDIDRFTGLAGLRVQLRGLRDDLLRARGVRERSALTLQGARDAAVVAREGFEAALHRAGKCPLCGAPAASAQIDQVV